MTNKTFGSDLIGKGENPARTIAQTADETVRDCNAIPPQQIKWDQNADGERWNQGERIARKPKY